MKIISVSTNIWKSPVGWWKAVPGRVKECDYVVEERKCKILAVYTFDGVSKKDKDSRIAFKGLKKVEDSIIVDRITERLDLSRKRGERNSVRYFEL